MELEAFSHIIAPSYALLRCAIREVVPSSSLASKSLELFGLSLFQIAYIYAKYFYKHREISPRNLLIVLHWLKDYPLWRAGTLFWRPYLKSDRSYRNIVISGIELLYFTLKEVRFT
jgi:hypothetical protein